MSKITWRSCPRFRRALECDFGFVWLPDTGSRSGPGTLTGPAGYPIGHFPSLAAVDTWLSERPVS